ncbi:hypothetical protein CLI75_12265, partial [Porphyromonas gingivalis]
MSCSSAGISSTSGTPPSGFQRYIFIFSTSTTALNAAPAFTGYSVFSTVFSVEWQDKKLNFIDCPGADDFIGGTVSALNVTDC